MDVALSIVVPTIARPSLERTLQSIVDGGANASDEVIVVWGDKGEPIDAISRVRFPCSVRVLYAKAQPKPDYGNTQKTAGMRAARGSHVAFMDDDDVYVAGGLEKMRAELSKNPASPHQFQVRLNGHHKRLIWTRHEVAFGNVTSIGIVVPNDPRLPAWPVRGPNGNLTRWGEVGNDVVFAEECQRLIGKFVFSEALVASWRP